jgi:hypothetical protein
MGIRGDVAEAGGVLELTLELELEPFLPRQ